jgi:hypothetical protein
MRMLLLPIVCPHCIILTTPSFPIHTHVLNTLNITIATHTAAGGGLINTLRPGWRLTLTTTTSSSSSSSSALALNSPKVAALHNLNEAADLAVHHLHTHRRQQYG